MQRYLVAQDSETGEILDGVPTARLCDVTSRRGPQPAYVENGIVYVRDDGYESPDGTYRNVRVIRNPEYREFI